MATTKIVSFSEIDAHRQCAFKHQLGYQERWRSPRVSPALSRGTLFHEVMDVHYAMKKKAQSALELERGEAEEGVAQIQALLSDPRSGEQTEEQELVEWMYRGYVDHYGLDPDWTVLGVEQKFEAWLPTEKGTRSSYKLKGRIDLVVRDSSAGDGMWLVDHKTCRNLPKDKDVDFDDQMALYVYLLKRAGHNIRGAIYNAVRTERLKTREMEPKERFLRKLSVRSDTELETIAQEALDEMREAYRPRHGRDARRSPDSERCGWRCDFTEACLAGRRSKSVSTQDVLAETGYVVDLERH